MHKNKRAPKRGALNYRSVFRKWAVILSYLCTFFLFQNKLFCLFNFRIRSLEKPKWLESEMKIGAETNFVFEVDEFYKIDENKEEFFKPQYK